MLQHTLRHMSGNVTRATKDKDRKASRRRRKSQKTIGLETAVRSAGDAVRPEGRAAAPGVLGGRGTQSKLSVPITCEGP